MAIKLGQEIIQFGKVRRFQGGNLMTGRHFVQDTRDASFVRVEYCHQSAYAISESLLQYTLFVNRHARQSRKTPDFEGKTFFGQLNRILNWVE